MTESNVQTPRKRVLLVRHGQTDWNAAGKWQGILQVPLNETGIAQAKALAASLKDRPITAVYASDLTRASLTAHIIAAAFGLPVIEDARLRELNLGDFQGLTFPEISAKFPAEVEAMNGDYMDFSAPNGERRRDMQARAYQALLDIIAADTGGGDVVIVSHGGTIRVLLIRLFGDDETLHQAHVGNTSVTIIESDGQTHQLIQRTASDHLKITAQPTTRDDV